MLIFIFFDAFVCSSSKKYFVVFLLFLCFTVVLYLFVGLGKFDYQNWEILRSTVLVLGMASAFRFIRITIKAGVDFKQIIYASGVFILFIVLAKVVAMLEGVGPPMSLSEILSDLWSDAFSPLLETVFFSIFVIYIFGFSFKGLVLTFVMSLFFSFFHTRFAALFYSLYFIIANLLLSFLYIVTKTLFNHSGALSGEYIFLCRNVAKKAVAHERNPMRLDGTNFQRIPALPVLP